MLNGSYSILTNRQFQPFGVELGGFLCQTPRFRRHARCRISPLMAMHPETFTFGDPFGATVAFVYFSVLAGVIGGVLFHIIRRLMRGALHAGVISVTIGLGAASLILGTLYLPLLSGFYEAEVADGRLLLHYILPTRVHEVSLARIIHD